MEHTPLLLVSNVQSLCTGMDLFIIDQSQKRSIGLNINEHIIIKNKKYNFLCVKVYLLNCIM